MKTRIVVLFMMLGLCVMQALPASPAETFSVNGLKVIFVQNKANDIIAANIYFR